jgi:hypothetical protein
MYQNFRFKRLKRPGYAFGEFYRPGLHWIDKFKCEHWIPTLLVLKKYQRNPRMVYTIRSMLKEQPLTEVRFKCP